MSELCTKCKHPKSEHQPEGYGGCSVKVLDAAGDVDWCPCELYFADRPKLAEPPKSEPLYGELGLQQIDGIVGGYKKLELRGSLWGLIHEEGEVAKWRQLLAASVPVRSGLPAGNSDVPSQAGFGNSQPEPAVRSEELSPEELAEQIVAKLQGLLTDKYLNSVKVAHRIIKQELTAALASPTSSEPAKADRPTLAELETAFQPYRHDHMLSKKEVIDTLRKVFS